MNRNRMAAVGTRIRWIPIVLASAFLIGPTAASAQDAESVLERAAQRYQDLEGFCADFQQVIEVTLLRQTTRSAGELCQTRSDRFEMRFSDPEGDRVVADGTYLWVYFPSTDDGQVFRTRIADSGGRFDLHREFLSDPGERYGAVLEGREVLNGRQAYVLSLDPRVPSPYVNARVWIDEVDHLIRKLVIREDSESIRTLEFSDIRTNPGIDDDRFRFDPPIGAQVIAR